MIVRKYDKIKSATSLEQFSQKVADYSVVGSVSKKCENRRLPAVLPLEKERKMKSENFLPSYDIY